MTTKIPSSFESILGNQLASRIFPQIPTNAHQEALWEIRWIAEYINSANPSLASTNPEFQEMIIQKYEHNVPLSYILKTQPFLNADISIRPPSLIPRPETEELTSLLSLSISQFFNHFLPNSIRILDIGTGSGAIPVGLSSLDSMNDIPLDITGIDISPESLSLAQENWDSNQNSDLHKFSPLLTSLQDYSGSCFDFIISNPPYIHLSMARTLDDSLFWEDPRALFIDYPLITPNSDSDSKLTPKSTIRLRNFKNQVLELADSDQNSNTLGLYPSIINTSLLSDTFELDIPRIFLELAGSDQLEYPVSSTIESTLIGNHDGSQEHGHDHHLDALLRNFLDRQEQKQKEYEFRSDMFGKSRFLLIK